MIRTTLQGISEDLTNRREHWASRARRRVWLARAQGEERAWRLRVQGLEQLEQIVDRTDKVPVAKNIDIGLSNLVHRGLENAVDTGIENYDNLTAKKIASIVKDLESRVQLLRVQHYEREHKERKTVLNAVTRRLDRLVPAVVPLKERTAEDHTEDAAAQPA